jgi:NAD(P)-dependent dehydrogenase (short-subunit alcohol dehydrogenase family)
MTRGIFIAGNESSLFGAIAAETAKRVESYAAAVIPNRFSVRDSARDGVRDGGLPPRAELPAGAISLSWNPASPISARTVLLAAENRLGKINDCILVCSPPAVYRSPDALSPEEIEILIDDHVKGWFFLIRELVIYFRRAGSGTLSFAAPEIKGGKNIHSDLSDLLGPSAASCFANYAGAVLASSANEPFQVMGFSGPETSEKSQFASWLFKMIDEGLKRNAGRWNKFSKSLFKLTKF